MKIDRRKFLREMAIGAYATLISNPGYTTEKLSSSGSSTGLEKITQDELSKYGLPAEIYQKRFEEYASLFDKYANFNPECLSSREFVSLLVAIAQKESSLGYPNNKKYDGAFTGYDSGNSHKGAEEQLKKTAEVICDALNGNNPAYKSVRKFKDKKSKILSVLRAYNRGDHATGDALKSATQYANEVYENSLKWRNYLSLD